MSFDPKGFGRRIAAARVWRGLEPKQVAQHLGLSAEAINRWERGGIQRLPPRGQLRLLSEILEQPAEWIAEGDAPPWVSGQPRSDTEQQDIAARRHDELVSRLEDLAEQVRALAVSQEGVRGPAE